MVRRTHDWDKTTRPERSRFVVYVVEDEIEDHPRSGRSAVSHGHPHGSDQSTDEAVLTRLRWWKPGRDQSDGLVRNDERNIRKGARPR